MMSCESWSVQKCRCDRLVRGRTKTMEKDAKLLQKRLRKLSKTLQIVRNRQAYVPVRSENARLARVRRRS